VLTINIDPILIHLGPLAISWYGLAVGAAILVGIWLTMVEAQRKGLPAEPVIDVMLWIAGGGLLTLAIIWAVWGRASGRGLGTPKLSS